MEHDASDSGRRPYSNGTAALPFCPSIAWPALLTAPTPPPPGAPDPTRLYRALRAIVRTLLHLFFREVTAVGTHHVPLDLGGLLVAGHPNGVIDPAVILSRFPGRLVFGARDGLLKWAIVGPLMRGLGTVPIYRAADHAGADGEAARRDANARSLDALAAEAASGSFTALFPEGQSHDLAHPTEIRSGAARLYARALVLAAEAGRPAPALLPVGLHYDAKATFRSRALVSFHRPLAVPDALMVRLSGPSEATETRAAVQELTDLIEHALHRATFAADDWDLVRTMHRARTLIRAEDA
ncbi:MAG TPA: 1-acyl-sn-glycerol-3-phosphate acyltransferase, partial [Rubricoccaceae bacterium]